jgi:hypothetical protein
MIKKYVDEIVRRIELLGYECRSTDAESQYRHIYKGEERLCILFDNGAINTNAYADIFNTAKITREYLEVFEQAEELKASGLSLGYRKLLDFNGYVLAMKELRSVKEYEFVTWQYSSDSKSVNYGYYNTDYKSAKEDFASRAGLINRSKMFSETQMKLIYASLVSFVGLSSSLDYRTEKAIGNILDKIGDIIPEIEDHKEQEDQSLISDDGLEL